MEGVHELGAEPAMLRRKAADTEQMQQRDFAEVLRVQPAY
jgi:hypothetical protein